MSPDTVDPDILEARRIRAGAPSVWTDALLSLLERVVGERNAFRTHDAGVEFEHIQNTGETFPMTIARLKERAEKAEADAGDLEDAFRPLFNMAKEMNEACDHSVGICWCEYHDALEKAELALRRGEG